MAEPARQRGEPRPRRLRDGLGRPRPEPREEVLEIAQHDLDLPEREQGREERRELAVRGRGVAVREAHGVAIAEFGAVVDAERVQVLAERVLWARVGGSRSSERGHARILRRRRRLYRPSPRTRIPGESGSTASSTSAGCPSAETATSRTAYVSPPPESSIRQTPGSGSWKHDRAPRHDALLFDRLPRDVRERLGPRVRERAREPRDDRPGDVRLHAVGERGEAHEERDPRERA